MKLAGLLKQIKGPIASRQVFCFKVTLGKFSVFSFASVGILRYLFLDESDESFSH